MRSKADCTLLAINVASDMFALFVDESNRGPSWTPAVMPGIIQRHVEMQAGLNMVPKNRHALMVREALAFYDRNLKKALEVLATYELPSLTKAARHL